MDEYARAREAEMENGGLGGTLRMRWLCKVMSLLNEGVGSALYD